jgi:hypothetical protein
MDAQRGGMAKIRLCAEEIRKMRPKQGSGAECNSETRANLLRNQHMLPTVVNSAARKH